MSQGVRELRASAGPVVLGAGAITIGLALVGVFAANHAGENIMGWYGDYVIPTGAVLVGLVAASGFGVSSYLTGTKISGGLLLAVVGMLAAGYGLAQYIEFRLLFPDGAADEQGHAIGFVAWYDAVTRSFRFSDHGHEGSTLDGWGYAFRALEVVGFVGGGALVPLLLRRLPYCDACGLYKRSRAIALIPASVGGKIIHPRRDPAGAAAQQAEMEAARTAADAALTAIRTAGRGADAEALRAAIQTGGPLERKRAAARLPARIAVSLVHCRRCHDGEVRAAMLTGKGNRIRRTPLPPSPASRDAIREFVR